MQNFEPIRLACLWVTTITSDVRRFLLASVLLVLIVALAGCGDEDDLFLGSNITGRGVGQSWELRDVNGVGRSPESFKGDVALVFFGFTQCPDICPTTLAAISEAQTLLGDRANRVQVLMVTVDPERDTPEILRGYLAAFSAGQAKPFLGLTGSSEDVRRTASSFRAYYTKRPTPDGDYTMDHSTSLYLLDQQGQARVLLSSQASAQTIAHDLDVLLREIH